jgi:hypothetical protein
MVLEKIWVFVEIDRFESKFAEAFTSVGIARGLRGDAATAEFRACAVLSKSLACCSEPQARA